MCGSRGCGRGSKWIIFLDVLVGVVMLWHAVIGFVVVVTIAIFEASAVVPGFILLLVVLLVGDVHDLFLGDVVGTHPEEGDLRPGI